MSKRIAPVELGCAGHFIGARHCAYRRHTQVGNYRVSTVGDLYWPQEPDKRSTLGPDADDFFETMVFPTDDSAAEGNEGCGCREVVDFSGLECVRYAAAGEAQRGHDRMVEKFARLDRLADGKGDNHGD